MLAIIGVIPAPGDNNYVPKDSLTKTILNAGVSQGYSVHLSAFADWQSKPAEHYHINQGNQITAPFISMSKACVEVVSLQLFLNSRGGFSKSKKFNNQTQSNTDHMRIIQGGIIGFIVKNLLDLAELTAFCLIVCKFKFSGIFEAIQIYF